MKQLRTRTVWSLLVCVLASAMLLAAGAPARAGLLGVSEQEEIEAGQQVRQQAYKEYGKPLPANNVMSRRVRVIGMRFANLSSRKNIPYSYEVLNNEKVLNAFAAPGGPIFVTKKLMETVSNDAELAYVLGHETAHVDHKHIVKAVEKQQKVSLGVGILGAIFGYNDNSLFNIFSNVAFTVWTQGYSRDQESDADHQGVEWMSELGFDPEAAISMLKKLDTGGGGGLDKYLSSHPDPKSREKAVAKQIDEDNLESVSRKAGGPSLSARNLPAFQGVSKNFAKDPYLPASSSNIGGDVPMIIAVPNGSYKVVLVAVRPFAEWADARIHVSGQKTTLKRDGKSIRLNTNSRSAKLNGDNRTMSVPAQIYQGSLYAPIGEVAAGVGGTVSWNASRHGVDVRVGDHSAFWALND